MPFIPEIALTMNKVHEEAISSVLSRGIPRNQGYITLKITAKRNGKKILLFIVPIKTTTTPPRIR
jgi:hypothetical protein